MSKTEAIVRKIEIPTTSWNAVSKGPEVSAGSKPSDFEMIGTIVPTNPAIFIDVNIEIATTIPNVN